MRAKRVRRRATAHAVACSPLMQADPVLAGQVDAGLHEHYTSKTAGSYATAAAQYVGFCADRGLRPFPVNAVAYCGWLHVKARTVKVTSLRMYMAGVRDASLLGGHGWHLSGHDLVRRTMRFLRKKYPTKAKGKKVPITVAVLHRILPLLPGWPDMARMSAADRVFAAASVTAVVGFLRGGEFLAHSGSVRPALKRADVQIRSIGPKVALVVSVRQPKTRPWLASVDVPCFAHEGDDTFCPVRLYTEYATRCPWRKTGGKAAFLLGGKPLSRNFMVARTTELMAVARVSFVDSSGAPMPVRAASWRAGAVCSAVAAGVSVPHIMKLGRWTSDAWRNYLLQAPLDLHRSAGSMWMDPKLCVVPAVAALGVVEFDVGGFFAPTIKQNISRSMAPLSLDIDNPQ